MGTIDFQIFLYANEKYYYFKYTDQIWCYYHNFSPFYGWFHHIEIYSKYYIGFTQFRIEALHKNTLTLPGMGYFEYLQDIYFFTKLYRLGNFYGRMLVYSNKTSLHSNFRTILIFPCGAMTHFSPKWRHFGPK